MTAKFQQINSNYWVSPQLTVKTVQEAAEAGFQLIVNNRPDGEMFGQPKGADIKAAAQAAGLAYAHIPISGGHIGDGHIQALKMALDEHGNEKALAFCKSGTRSAFLYAYAAAASGRSVSEIVAEAAKAGFDVSSHAPLLEQLHLGASENNE